MSSLYGWRQLETDYFKEHGNVENKSNSSFNFLTTICDNKVYTWNMISQSVVVTDYSDLVTAKKDVQAQAYRLKTIVTFIPINLDVKSHRGVYCLLWGDKGAALIQLPAAAFQNDEIKAASVFLGEKIHVECSKLNVLSAKLAVDSLRKVAVVLYDDTFLRIYEAADGNILEVVCASNVNQSPLNMDESPCEKPVDFDFGPVWPKSKLWTIFVLRATGNIQYFLVRILDKAKSCNTQEFSPIVTDLGIDWESGDRATGVHCITQFPTVVVVTSNTGNISHCNVVPSYYFKETDAKSTKLKASGGGSIDIGGHSEGQATSKPLSIPMGYNLEKLMLENQVTFQLYASLITNSKKSKHLSFTKLIIDPLHEHRYLFIHDYGALMVTDYAAEEFLQFLENPVCELPTKPTAPSISLIFQWSFNSERNLKVLKGAAFSDSMPQSLLFVRGDSKSLIRGLSSPDDYQPKKLSSHLEPSSSFTNPAVCNRGSKKPPDSCDDFLDGSLKSLKSTPIPPLRIGEHASKVKEAKSHINAAISSCEMTIDEVAQVIEKFIATFKKKSAWMSNKLSELIKENHLPKDQAELLAESCEKSLTTSDSLKTEMEGTLRNFYRSNPVVTDKEKNLLKTLENIGDDIIDLQGLVEGFKRKLSLSDPPCNLTEKLSLTPSQLKLTRDKLQDLHQELHDQEPQNSENTSGQTEKTTNQQ